MLLGVCYVITTGEDENSQPLNKRIPFKITTAYILYNIADLIRNLSANATENEAQRNMRPAFIGMVAGCYVIPLCTYKAFYSASPQEQKYRITRKGKNVN